jgi:hypothetical protein
MDTAATNFLQFLVDGSWWLLQDLAVLQDTFPQHPVFRQKVFKHAKWADFKAQVVDLHNNADAFARQVLTSFSLREMCPPFCLGIALANMMQISLKERS